MPHEDEREDNPEQAMEPSHLAPFAALREVDCQAVAAAVRHRPAVLRGRTARGGRFELGYPVSSGPGSDAINEGLREYLASIRREADRELWENEGLEVECDVVAPRPVSRFVSLVCETHWLGAGRPSVNVHAFTFERCASTARLLDLQDLCRADVNCDEASLAWANQYQDPRLKIGFTSAPERPRDTGGRAWYTDVPRLGELALGPDGVTVYLQNRLAHVNYSLGTVHVPIAALRDSFAPDVLREWN